MLSSLKSLVTNTVNIFCQCLYIFIYKFLVVKNGHNSCGTQRYKCKAVFVWKYKKEQKLPKHRDKRKILDCYAEGMGINAIAQVPNLNNYRLVDGSCLVSYL